MALKTPDMLRVSSLQRVKEFLALGADETLVLVFDRTMMGSAKTGLAITDRRTVEYDEHESKVIPHADVTSVRVEVAATNAMVHALTLETRSGAKLETSVVLNQQGMDKLLAALRDHLPPTAHWQTGARSSWERRIHRGADGFVLSTTPTIEGRPIRAYLGIVSGEAVLGANLFADFEAAVSDVIGGRSGPYEREFIAAREAAFGMLEEAALQLGANAVVGIDVDYEVLGGKSSMMLVSVNGTAVVLSDPAV